MVELDVGQAPGTYAKACLLRSMDRRIGPIIKKTRLVKTTKPKVLSESDVNSVSPPELAQLMATRSSTHKE
jgi:hypothetical protein